MPNWVRNSVSIYGASNEVGRLRNLLVEPHPLHPNLDDDGNDVGGFTFHNLISPPKERWKDYDCGALSTEDMKANPYNWYDWNVNNWGTKWDACDVEISLDQTVDNRSNLHLSFDTAWSPPGPIMVALYQLCVEAGLGMEWFYEEEQGWGGEILVNEAGDGNVNSWGYPEYDEETDRWEREATQTITIDEWIQEVKAELESTKKAIEGIRNNISKGE